MNNFANTLILWQRAHGRHHLPWQQNRNVYHVWLSEVMLQQTQVSKVIEYFDDFIQRWPTITDLASASEDEVLQAWSGMGYYRRAKNLHKAAKKISDYYHQHGTFPQDVEWWKNIDGVGQTTAHAICAQSFGQPLPILDANARRVYGRINNNGNISEKQYWELAFKHIKDITSSPKKDIVDYTQGLMDLGSSVCKATPQCSACPVKSYCQFNPSTYQSPVKKESKKIEETIAWGVCIKDKKIAIIKNNYLSIWDSMFVFPLYSDHHADDIKFLEFEHVLTHKKLCIQCYHIKDVSHIPNIEWIDISELTQYARPKPMDIVFTSAAFLALYQDV